MKQLIFIDNDHEKIAKEEADYAKDVLAEWANLPVELIDNMIIIPNFYHMDKEKQYKLLFNPNNAIVTWSMYTPNNYGSLYQLVNFLDKAGVNEIKNMIYFDTSGNLTKYLKIRDLDKRTFGVMKAIESNYIFSFDFNETENDKICFRVRINLTKGYYEKPFKKEYIDIVELLK